MDDKKERIITIAEQLFARFGIQKTTMEDIAKKARMGKSTMYYYFKSKEEVFAEVMRRDSVIFKLELNQAIARGKTPQEKISNYVLARMKHLKALSSYYLMLTDEYIEHFTFVDSARKDFLDFENITLSTLLNEGVHQGIFDIENVETTARNFAICLKGLEYPFFTKDMENDIEKCSNQMLKKLFKGIEAR
ncbi:MAG: TetR/AcrR family transcriptional regulator [Melioribacteraceae bacterium]|jgi:AcrR family transcriptional regulator|nr:TetR/AcrR family transcriptional regulator [Melioribacteraceae bacterium]